MVSLRKLLSAGAVILVGAFVFQACGKQSEGMRCEIANGNEDCDPGLECVQKECCNERICCPKAGSETTAECKGGAAVSDAAVSETTATDTGAPDTAPADTAPADTTPPADTGTDSATVDAADSGG